MVATVAVKTTFFSAFSQLILTTMDTIGLVEGLAERFLDPEEKVRSVACKIIGELDYETSLHHVQKDTLLQVGHRCRDKKVSNDYDKL